MHLNGENCSKETTCRKWANGLKIYDSEKEMGPQGLVYPHTEAINMYITIIFKDRPLKLLGQSKPNFIGRIYGNGEPLYI